MIRRHRRFGLAVMLIASVSAGAVLALSGALRGGEHEGEVEAEVPAALGMHLEKLKEALPGNEGKVEEGPASASEGAFLQRAYPEDTISVAQMSDARAAVAASKGRPFPSGKGRKGTWVSVGPSEALYPGEPELTSFVYVPNTYVAGGRTTSIAIASSCKPGNCRAYITAAGGGVWRTKNALNGQPNWPRVKSRWRRFARRCPTSPTACPSR